MKVVDAESPSKLDDISVALKQRDRIAIKGEDTRGQVNSAGEFLIPSVLSDEYYLNVTGLPGGAYLKAANLQGMDVLRDFRSSRREMNSN